MKHLVAEAIAKRVKSGEIIGIGTGSTVDLAIEEIGKRIKSEKLQVSCLTSSDATSRKCTEHGLIVLNNLASTEPEWGFDGADEVDADLNLIKGGGGALLQEKILAKRVKKFIVIVDESKIVTALGQRVPVPVEVIPSAVSLVKKELLRLGAKEISLRAGSGVYGAAITENGNNILDVRFQKIPTSYEKEIKSLVGVVENGIFINYADTVLIGQKNGLKILERK